ncbi:DUF6311 domain-containing protein [Sphingomonas sp.]|jgi:hypothetical protein|uniref:DUF6311 domain-containing protein n=1 Tax=Sphingomonas sp. TaxID=28214 RepID=UPI00356281AA
MRPFSRPLIDLMLVVAGAVGLFALFFHLAMLNPHNIGWLLTGTDNGENALGLHAWLKDPHAHGFRTQALNAPDGVSLLFTDSNPLLAVLAVPLTGLLGGDIQLVGPWYLLCLMLHVALARAVLVPYARTPLALWSGVLLLSLLPTLYVREVHANLCAHWLILWALWIFIDPRRAADWRWWLAVLGVSALIHSYLLLMVAAIWGSAMLERLVRAPGERGRTLLGAGVVLAVVAGVLSMLVDRGGLISSGTYGRFGMPLDALWNPAISAMSVFLPAIPQAADRQMEAFQYLGAGLLLLVVAAPILHWRAVPSPSVTTLHRRLCWLIPALVVLALLAISNRVDLAGRTVLTIPLSAQALALVDPVRASSRLFWPVAYVLALTAITQAYRLAPRRAALLLVGALALQMIDMIGVIGYTRHQTAAADAPVRWRITRDPRWASVIAQATDVTFMPPDATRQLDLFQEIAWRAVDAHRPVRLVYAARTSRVTAERLATEYRAFQQGRLVPGRLYVILPNTPIPAAARTRLATLDGVRVVLPTVQPR